MASKLIIQASSPRYLSRPASSVEEVSGSAPSPDFECLRRILRVEENALPSDAAGSH